MPLCFGLEGFIEKFAAEATFYGVILNFFGTEGTFFHSKITSLFRHCSRQVRSQ
jgi:hypothetical protein